MALLLVSVNASTYTTLNGLQTPLTISQGQVPFSGTVVSGSGAIPNGATVQLQYSISPDGPFTVAATYPLTVTTLGGAYSGTFTGPPSAGTYYIRAVTQSFTTGGVTYTASASSLQTIIVTGTSPPATTDFWQSVLAWLDSGMVFGIPNWFIIAALIVAWAVLKR